MKDATFTLEFTTHVLANSIGPDGERDRFQRDVENRVIWQQGWWHSAFSRSIEMAHLRGIKASDINMNLATTVETELYKRHYGPPKEDNFRIHEAILPGTQVTFEAVVADRITGSVLKRILERMGAYVGISPYGYRLGFGKFSVVDVKVAPSESGELDPANLSDENTSD